MGHLYPLCTLLIVVITLADCADEEYPDTARVDINFVPLPGELHEAASLELWEMTAASIAATPVNGGTHFKAYPETNHPDTNLDTLLAFTDSVHTVTTYLPPQVIDSVRFGIIWVSLRERATGRVQERLVTGTTVPLNEPLRVEENGRYELSFVFPVDSFVWDGNFERLDLSAGLVRVE